MMIYDITNQEKALTTLAKMTKLSESRVQQFINEHVVIENIRFDATKLTVENFLSEFMIDEETLDIKELDVYVIHYTSNYDDCQSINESGLRDLKYTLSNNTPLKNFLEDNGICFNIDSGVMYIRKEPFDIKYDQSNTKTFNELSGIARKVYSDNSTSCFLFTESVETYGSEIHLNPEILHDLNKLRPNLDLINKWRRISKSYEVAFISSIDNLNIEFPPDPKSIIYKLLHNALAVASGTITDFVQASLSPNTIITNDMMTIKLFSC
jgi:hypothetical protein